LSKTETIAIAEYRFKLIGVLATAAGSREISIDGPSGLSLSELVSRLVLLVNKQQFRDLLIDSGTNNPLPNVIIMLNDQDCNLFEGLRTRLDTGTTVTVIPVAHGG
jgi:molybdopterin converting factor small subunit